MMAELSFWGELSLSKQRSKTGTTEILTLIKTSVLFLYKPWLKAAAL